jgi:hypothetical protein
VHDTAALLPYLDDARADFVALRARDLAALSPAVRARLVPVGSVGEYRLMQEPHG